jgi:hypothetical protein
MKRINVFAVAAIFCALSAFASAASAQTTTTSSTTTTQSSSLLQMLTSSVCQGGYNCSGGH